MANTHPIRIPLNRAELARLFSWIEPSKTRSFCGTQCWEWQGSLIHGGYGRFRLRGIRHRAHRLFYEAFVEVIPPELDCDHLCRNPPCVNPAHIDPVPTRVNVLRAPESLASINFWKTECPKGHPLAGDNLVAWELKQGKRACKTCARARYRSVNSRRVRS